jgi:hypothetical protein
MIGFIAPYTFTFFRDYRQLQRYRYSTHFQFIVAHALCFSLFASRILATDLSQSHCNFQWHVKSSRRSIILFLPFLQLPILKTRLDYSRLLLYTPSALSVSTLYYSVCTTTVLQNISDNHFARTPRKTPSSIVQNACLLVCYLATDVLLSRARVLRESVTDPLPSNGYTCHNI